MDAQPARPSRRFVIAAALSVTALAGLTLANAAGAAQSTGSTSWTPSTYTARLASLVNNARVQHGLPKLTVTSGTSTVALSWAQHLASTGSLSHNPDVCSDVAKHGSPDWTVVEENVGEGSASDPDGLFTAYMNSPEHRSNILSRSVRYLGNGVVFGSGANAGMAWNTMDFVDQYGTSSTSQSTSQTTSRTTSTPRHHHHATAPAPAPIHVAAPAPAPVHVAVHAAPAHRSAHRHVAARPAPVRRPAVERALVVDPVSAAAPIATRPTALASATNPGGTPISHLALVGVAAGLLLAYAPLSLAVRARRVPAAS